MKVKELNQDYTVNTEFVNKQTGERYSRVYPFEGYCQNVSHELKQVLYQVENIFYRLENHKDRSEWSEESTEEFGEIRRKLLNNINNIARLPATLHHKGVPCTAIPANEMLANMINNR